MLLVDEIDGHFDPATPSRSRSSRIDQLGVPNLVGMCFRYTVLELNTALKPSFLAHLFARHGFEKVVDFDPDILVLGDLDRLLARLDEAAIVLTPHLTAPLPDDGLTPSEINILQAGTYNLGFIALRAGRSAERFLAWWEDRLADRCSIPVARGMLVDQKWIDLVPGFFDGVTIVRDPSCNAARWNLPRTDRSSRTATGYVARRHAVPVLPLQRLRSRETRYGSRSTRTASRCASSCCPALELYAPLSRAPARGGIRDPSAIGPMPSRPSTTASASRPRRGVSTSQLGDRARRFGNPFEQGRPQSFFAWLNQPIDRRADIVVTRLWHAIHGTTPAMQAAFPDVLGADRLSFANWTAHHGGAQHGVDAQLIPELTDAEGQPASSGRPDAAAHLSPRLVEPALPVLKPLVRGTVARNPRVWQQIVHTRMKLTGDPRLRAARVIPARTAPRAVLGVNVAGYAQSEKGVGEAMRSQLRNLEAAGIPYVVNNFVDHFSDNRDTSVDDARRRIPTR